MKIKFERKFQIHQKSAKEDVVEQIATADKLFKATEEAICIHLQLS